MIEVGRIGRDKAPFRVEYEPDHPAADKSGYVKMPNVNMLVELADMREANRSYEADLQIVKQQSADDLHDHRSPEERLMIDPLSALRALKIGGRRSRRTAPRRCRNQRLAAEPTSPPCSPTWRRPA